MSGRWSAARDGTLTNRCRQKVFEDHADAYAPECGMKVMLPTVRDAG